MISLRAAASTTSPDDCTDSIIMITSHSMSASRRSEDEKDIPLDHRLPSPEEQCQTLASKYETSFHTNIFHSLILFFFSLLRYPAQLIRVDTSGKRFDRQSAARKSLLHVQTGIAAQIEEQANDSSNTDSVKRRSRSRKPRGNRRNTIAGIDQTEIEEIAVNGFVLIYFNSHQWLKACCYAVKPRTLEIILKNLV